MAANKQSRQGKTALQLQAEREQNFYKALSKIEKGQSRKQAILQSGMDPRTFNRMLQEREKQGVPLLERTDRKGHYKVGSFAGSVNLWPVLHKDGTVTQEYFDPKYSSTLGSYWATVENMLYYGYNKKLQNFKPTTVYTIDGKKITLLVKPSAVRTWWDNLDNETQDLFGDILYVKEVSYAA